MTNTEKIAIIMDFFVFEKKAKAIAHGFFQKMALKSPPIFITFSDTY